MHVLFLHQFFCTTNSPHGTRHFEFAEKLKATGFRLTALASPEFVLADQQAAAKWSPWLIVKKVWVPVMGSGSYVWRIYSFIVYMISAVWVGVGVKDVDVVLGTTPSLFQAFAAWVLAVIKRKPFVLEVRDLWPAFAVDIGLLKNRFLISVAECLETFLYKRADHIIVNSPAYTQYLVEKGVPEEKVTLVANGADPDFFAVTDKVAREAALLRDNWLSEHKFVVVYTGAIRMANYVDVLLDVADLLQQHGTAAQLVVVGDGTERSRLEQIVAQRQLLNVRFVGSVAKEKMPAVLAAADAGFASLKPIRMFQMTYPNKVFDYMAAGKPVVLAIDGVIREVVESADAGLFAPCDDVAGIAEAIECLVKDRTTAERMGDGGREAIRQRFNRATQAKEFARVFERLLETKQSDEKTMAGVRASCHRRRVAA